jgi:GT2 family glycosyltransferase
VSRSHDDFLGAQLAIVICTKDRPDQLKNVLQCVFAQTVQPTTVVVVDSSEDARSESLCSELNSADGSSLVYLRSAPSLPHQRNIAIEYCLENGQSCQLSYIWFLDDDIVFEKFFFQRGLEVFLEQRDLALLGSYDKNFTSISSKLVTSIASLQIARGGRILRSGLVVPPIPHKRFQEYEFVPGFSMLISIEALDKVRFDSSIRMYGEDVEFQLRLAEVGRIGCSKLLGLCHNSSALNRESARNVSSYSDGFRWRLHKDFPELVWGSMVILSSMALLLGNITYALINWCPTRLSTALGHWDFLLRLLRRLPVEQQITIQ